jgi:hypothetical protein
MLLRSRVCTLWPWCDARIVCRADSSRVCRVISCRVVSCRYRVLDSDGGSQVGVFHDDRTIFDQRTHDWNHRSLTESEADRRIDIDIGIASRRDCTGSIFHVRLHRLLAFAFHTAASLFARDNQLPSLVSCQYCSRPRAHTLLMHR